MPKIAINLKDRQEKLSVLIGGSLLVSEMTQQSLAEILGISTATLRARLNHPSDLTIREVVAISKALGIPADEMRSSINFQ